MTHGFITRHLAGKPDAIAPDGSEVRLLAATQRGLAHRSVEEVWFSTAGEGQLLRKNETANPRSMANSGSLGHVTAIHRDTPCLMI